MRAFLIIVAALLVVGCGQGRSNPFASFDSKCADLPASRFNDIPPDTAQSFAMGLGAPSITQIEYDQ